MKSSLKKALELLHFPLFLCVLLAFQSTIGRVEGAIQDGIESLLVAPLERDVLGVLSRIANISSLEGFLVVGIVVLVFTVVSTSRRQFIINLVTYLFFLFFFTAYFYSHLAPEMASLVSTWTGISIAGACAVVLLFAGLPAFVLRRLNARAEKRREGRSLVVASFKQCKVCGAQFLSNPSHCSRCLSDIA